MSRINVWDHPLSIWKTKASYFSWIRGQIRRIWADNPLRKVWKKEKLRPVTKEEKKNKVFHPSTKNVGQCVQCEEWMAGSKLEVDHLLGESSCTTYEEAQEFLWHCASDNPDNWALVCKPCHKIKTYAESYGMTFEGARAEKEVILRGKQPISKQREELLSWGFTEDEISNADKRREAYRRKLNECNREK